VHQADFVRDALKLTKFSNKKPLYEHLLDLMHFFFNIEIFVLCIKSVQVGSKDIAIVDNFF